MLAGQLLLERDDFVKKQQSTVAPNSPSAATSIKRHLTDDNKEHSYWGISQFASPHSSKKKRILKIRKQYNYDCAKVLQRPYRSNISAHTVPAVGLQISDGDNFFIDEKLNGLFLPVIDVAL